MGNKGMRSWNGWEPWLRAWLRWWPLTSHASTGGSGTMGHNAQEKVGVVGNTSETGINPSLAAPCGCCCREWRNNGQGGMEPSAPGEALEHHHLWVGKRRRGAEMQLGRDPSLLPALAAASVSVAAEDGLFQLGTQVSFIFLMQKQAWI